MSLHVFDVPGLPGHPLHLYLCMLVGALVVVIQHAVAMRCWHYWTECPGAEVYLKMTHDGSFT